MYVDDKTGEIYSSDPFMRHYDKDFNTIWEYSHPLTYNHNYKVYAGLPLRSKAVGPRSHAVAHDCICVYDEGLATKIVKLDKHTGKKVWGTKLRGASFNEHPTISKDVVYTFSINTECRYLAAYCLKTGKELWALPYGRAAMFQMFVDSKGRLYTLFMKGNKSYTLHCYDNHSG